MAIELTTATTEQLSGIRESLYTPIDPTRMFPQGRWVVINGQNATIENSQYGTIADFKNCQFLKSVSASGNTLQQILNASDLTNIENLGTSVALNLTNHPLNKSALDQLFTDLPATNKTATIRVTGCSGAATCDTSIATNKGYTVVTS
jgi:hypothetical protein